MNDLDVQHRLIQNSKSPDELSMFNDVDDDVDATFPFSATKREPVDLDAFTADSSATLHALELLASLDGDATSPEATYSSPDRTSKANASGSAPENKAPPTAKTKMTAEEKKRRNRDCMRRLRNRRNDLIVTMRHEIQALETQLNQQLEISQTGLSTAPSGSHPEKSASHNPKLKRLQQDHARIKTAMRRLREENYWLQKQITQRQESLEAMRQLMDTRDEACPLVDMDALDEEDIGVWIRSTHHFYRPLEDARAFEIVMESFRMIQAGIRITQKMRVPPNTVLGWSDQRSVDANWSNFMMRKSFAQESPRQLALKTWQLMSNVATISILQPKTHEMKLLQRLNEFTVVIARSTYFEDSKFNYCVIYLLFMLETDDGFVVGTRSMDPDEKHMIPFTSDRMVVARPFHCFHFQHDPVSGGCKVTFAGRVDNVVDGVARNCAMDMLLAMMRWESHCVSPLWRLTS